MVLIAEPFHGSGRQETKISFFLSDSKAVAIKADTATKMVVTFF
jgi:hypothetical protein